MSCNALYFLYFVKAKSYNLVSIKYLSTDPPKQCNQGFQWKSKNGVDYIYSSEYLISPDPLKIKPFMVRCDKDLFPGTGG